MRNKNRQRRDWKLKRFKDRTERLRREASDASTRSDSRLHVGLDHLHVGVGLDARAVSGGQR